MKRPAFQFYPADWRNNANLRRCSWAARGVWIEVMGLMHDSDEYGALHWSLKEIAQALGCQVSLMKELASKEVLKGCDTGRCSTLIYVPRSGRRDGEPVTLVQEQDGPIWYSSRMVKDEYVRTIRGENNRFGETIGDTPKPSPKPNKGDGSTASSSSSPSVNLKPEEESSPVVDLSRDPQTPPEHRVTIQTPSEPGQWLAWFNSEHGLNLDPVSRYDRKGFWPLAVGWCKAGITTAQMTEAITQAQASAKEPIASLPAYADTVLRTMTTPQARASPGGKQSRRDDYLRQQGYLGEGHGNGTGERIIDGQAERVVSGSDGPALGTV